MTLNFVGSVQGLQGFLFMKEYNLTKSFLYRNDPKKYGLLEFMQEAIDDEAFRVRFNDEAPQYPPEAEQAMQDSILDK